MESIHPGELPNQGTEGACASPRPKPLSDTACIHGCGEANANGKVPATVAFYLYIYARYTLIDSTIITVKAITTNLSLLQASSMMLMLD